jgi:hypothetical protein
MTYRRPAAQTLVLTAVVATMASALLAFSKPAEMVVDGQRVVSDVPPITTPTEKVFVPLRSLADALGAETMVDGSTIDVVRGNQSLHLKIGDVHATINGMPFTLKSAPFRVRGRVMISLRPIASAFGVSATYDARTARVEIVTPGLGATNSLQTPQAQ